MTEQLSPPKDQVEVYFHSQQPYTHVSDYDLARFDAGRLLFPNRYFDPQKAHALYNQYHEQYAFADEVGLDGIMTNEHHSYYGNMKPSANLDATVISKITKRVKIAILGNILPIVDPVRISEEVGHGGLLFRREIDLRVCPRRRRRDAPGGLKPGGEPGRFEEAHDLIIKCWTEPGPFRYEGKYYHYRAVNPWVLPIQKPHPPIWFPGNSSPESVSWAATHGYTYVNLGALIELTTELKQIYIDTAHEVGFKPGPEHFGYQLRALVADSDEKAQELGRAFMWTMDHRQRGPREHPTRLSVQRGAVNSNAAAHRAGPEDDLREAPRAQQHHRGEPGDGH